MLDDVEVVRMPDVYRTILPGLDVTLPSSREGFETVLRERFPSEREGITRFMARLDVLETEIRISQDGKKPPNPFAIGHLLRYLPLTWNEVLEGDVTDPFARAALSQLWGYFGPGPSQVSFVLFGQGLRTYLVEGLHYIKGRSQALTQAFADRIRALGGEVRLTTGVERITTRDGRATGVVTEHGDVIEARAVLANASPVVVVNELLPPGSVPRRFHESLRFRAPSPSSVNIFLGLEGAHDALGLTDYEVFVNDDTDFDEHARRTRSLVAPGMVSATCYNAAWPDISPPGTTVAVLTSLMYLEPWLALAPEEYEARKNDIAAAMLGRVEKALGADLRGAAEVITVSTPLTNARYAGTVGGALYGSQPLPHNAHVMRVPYRGPIGGLYFAGAWTPPGGAFDSAITGGRNAARVILGDLEKELGAAKRGAA